MQNSCHEDKAMNVLPLSHLPAAQFYSNIDNWQLTKYLMTAIGKWNGKKY